MHDQSSKVCKGCGEEWPVTRRFFHYASDNRDGFHHICRACKATTESRHQATLANMRAPEGLRACSKCLEPKPKTPEFFHKRGNGGLRTECKVCVNKRYREYIADPFRGAEYVQRHREYAKQRWRTDSERLSAENSQRRREAKLDPERADGYRESARACTAKRRALKLAAGESYTKEDVARLYGKQEGLCAYCPKPLLRDYEVDHVVPLSRGGSNGIENIALACMPCNRSKGSKSLEEWTASR